MAAKARIWSDLDKRIAQYFTSLRSKDISKNSFRVIGDATGMSHTRVADILKQSGGTPTVQEFVSLCLYFGKTPSTTMRSLEDELEVEEKARTDEQAEIADKEARIQRTLKKLKDPKQRMALAAYQDPDKERGMDPYYGSED